MGHEIVEGDMMFDFSNGNLICWNHFFCHNF